MPDLVTAYAPYATGLETYSPPAAFFSSTFNAAHESSAIGSLEGAGAWAALVSDQNQVRCRTVLTLKCTLGVCFGGGSACGIRGGV